MKISISIDRTWTPEMHTTLVIAFHEPWGQILVRECANSSNLYRSGLRPNASRSQEKLRKRAGECAFVMTVSIESGDIGAEGLGLPRLRREAAGRCLQGTYDTSKCLLLPYYSTRPLLRNTELRKSASNF